VIKRNIKYKGGRHTVEYGKRRIDYELLYSQRDSLTINVHPDLSVVVKAPAGKAPAEVAKRVKRKAPWIIRQLTFFDRFQPLPSDKDFVGGETHLYLGRQYRLKIVESSDETVKLIGKCLKVFTKHKSDADWIRKLVRIWFDLHAKAALERRLLGCMETAKRADIPHPPILYRYMKRRWGSCTKTDQITLNIELARAPVHCIDYVIMHELCHLKHKDHSSTFWKLLSKLMPDWEVRKKRLEEVII